jgi:hypothetical protein
MRRRSGGRRALAALVLLAACGPAVAVTRRDVPQAPPSFLVQAAAMPAYALPPTRAAPSGPTPDELAGLTSRDVPQTLNGTFDVVPGTVLGTVPAPGAGPVTTVRVETEQGLPVDAQRFAGFVMDTLDDPHGWGAGGRMSFVRTGSDDATIQVLLASPDTLDRLCSPIDTTGELSCRSGARAVLNFYRWVNGQEDYAGNTTGYRRYLVNHEVGHVLGHGHEPCPGAGMRAPVMQQQTLGLNGCTQNPWPYP